MFNGRHREPRREGEGAILRITAPLPLSWMVGGGDGGGGVHQEGLAKKLDSLFLFIFFFFK